MRRFLTILSLAGLWATVLAPIPAAVSAPPLVADISSKQISITTSFTGTKLLLFGAIDGGGDVVVVVRGPRREMVVRRKERVAGIWVNGSEQHFNSVPGYYFVASNRPLAEIASEKTLNRMQIGISRLRLPRSGEDDTVGHGDEFHAGLVAIKQKEGLFSMAPERVEFVGRRLFRADLTFPANVPIGAYTAEVYLFRNGEIAGSSKTTLAVRKAALEAAIYNFAHEHSAFYGIIAIVIALFAGWLAGAIFRKV